MTKTTTTKPATEMKTADTSNADKLTQVRGSVYGPPIKQFNIAQRLKFVMNEGFKENEIQRIAALSGQEFDLVAEALDMIAVKLSRIVTGDPTYLDNWDDIAGYVACVTKYFRAKELEQEKGQ